MDSRPMTILDRETSRGGIDRGVRIRWRFALTAVTKSAG